MAFGKGKLAAGPLAQISHEGAAREKPQGSRQKTAGL